MATVRLYPNTGVETTKTIGTDQTQVCRMKGAQVAAVEDTSTTLFVERENYRECTLCLTKKDKSCDRDAQNGRGHNQEV